MSCRTVKYCNQWERAVPLSMQAAICHAFNTPLALETAEIDEPRAGEVRVRIAAVAVCHSDIHYLRGERAVTPPFIVGHEAAGTIEATGPGVDDLPAGTRVVVSLIRSCGGCPACVRGEPYHCEGSFDLAIHPRVRDAMGTPIGDADLGVSGFAEYAVVHRSQVVPLPDDLPFEQACLLGCGVITGVGAVVNTARTRPGDRVAVIGAGGVGLNAVQGARIAGAARIVAVDTSAPKLDAAGAFGATDVVDAHREDVVQAVQAAAEGRGLDAVFVTVGSAQAAESGLRMLHAGGTLVIVGLPSPRERMSFVMREVGWAGQHIVGSTMGSTRLSEDIPWLIDLWRQGRLKLAELITGRYALAEINEAIASVERGEARRNVILQE